MKKLLFYLFLVPFISEAQLTEDFSDGDFTNSPTWSGTTADFIVNASNEMQLNNTIAATSYLSTPHLLSTLDNSEWRFNIRQNFAPSSSNYGRVYLTSASNDLTTNPDGFYLQLGDAGSIDAVRLFKCVSGVSTQICATPDGTIVAAFDIGIRVFRDNLGNWELSIDPAGGTNYGTLYTGTDATSLLGTHCGFLAVYTLSNATRFHYDDIYVGPEIVDVLAPTLVSSTAISNTQIDVLFSEPISGAAAVNPSNYSLSPSVAISSATIDGTNTALVHLVTSANLTNGTNYSLTVSSIDDLAGNTATNLTGNFSYLVGEVAVKGDLIINEFMADQSPVIGLPEVEFIEIYNKSTKYFDLTGWKIGDASSDGTIVSGFISPGEYKILCSTSSLTDYPLGYAVTSFPSLNNSGDDVVLKSNTGVIIDKLTYSDTWYNNDIKADGGYSLERINSADPCSDANNWTASNAIVGGTPGVINSVNSTVPDTQIPTLVSANALVPNFLELNFSEGMDSSSIANAVYSFNPNLSIQTIFLATTYTNQALIAFNENFAVNQLYTFSVNTVADCWLNATSISSNFALADEAVAGDLIINEILYDPSTGGTDFIELYNKSSKVLNLKDYIIANFDNDTIANPKIILGNYTLFPNEYVVLTADSMFVKNTFPATIPGTFIEMSLPSLNNDSSTIYLISNTNLLLDKVSYTSDWQFSLLDDTENKTLERIDPNGISNNKSNWHTAAEPIGFGTPGGRNSQYMTVAGDGTFSSNNPVFSPDNDGFEDVIFFTLKQEEVGNVSQLTIYDDFGREVKKIWKSELTGTENQVSWDGVNENGIKAPLGIYFAVVSSFNSNSGKTYSKRIAFTLAGKLN
jgi:hypothetical protein